MFNVAVSTRQLSSVTITLPPQGHAESGTIVLEIAVLGCFLQLPSS